MSDGDFVVIGHECFADPSETVISWRGANYYKACDEPVVTNPDGSGSHCVKRENHPGDIHEDYDGNRIGDIKDRIAVVVTHPIDDDISRGHANVQAILKTLKPHFQDKGDVRIYAAVRQQADQIIMILEGDG